MRKLNWILANVVILLTLILVGCSDESRSTSIQIDPDWSSTKLTNGMQLHAFNKPEEAISLRLVVHAGSMQESKDQVGYAHFLEHLAFSGFLEQDKRRNQAFESAGIQFGVDQNAYTDYEFTVYELDIPDDKLIEPAFQWMRHIASGIQFLPQSIATEQGAVLGEFRQRLPNARPYSLKSYEHSIDTTPFSKRDPLGTIDSINHIDVEELQKFYHKWYQPQNMELVVAGDLSQVDISLLFAQFFAELPEGDTPRRPRTTINDLTMTPFVTGKIPGESSVFELVFSVDGSSIDTLEAQQRYWYTQSVGDAIYNRLSDEIARSHIPTSWIEVLDFKIAQNGLLIVSLGFDEQHRTALQQMLVKVLGEMRDHGIHENEFLAVKKPWQQLLDDAAIDRENMDSAQHVSVLISNIEQQQPTQSQAQYVENLAQFISALQHSDLNAQLKTVLANTPTVFINADVSDISNQLASINGIENRYKQATKKPIKVALNQDLPQPDRIGTILATGAPTDDMVYWKLSNDIEVLYLQQKQAGSSIYGWFSSLGGIKSLEPNEYASARLLPELVNRGGIGDISDDALVSILRKSNSWLEMFVEDTQHGAVFQSNEEGLVETLNIINAGFMATKVNTELLSVAKQSAADELSRLQEDPVYALWDDGSKDVIVENSFLMSSSEADINNVNDKQIQVAYQKLFRNNTGFKLFLVGAKDASSIEAAIRQYISSIAFEQFIPYQPQHAYKHIKEDFVPQQIIRRDTAIDGKTQIFEWIVSERSEPRTAKQVFAEDMLSRIASERVFSHLRSEEGLDYSPSAYFLSPDGGGIDFWWLQAHVEPNDEKRAMSAFSRVLSSLAQGVTQSERDNVVKQLINDLNALPDNPQQYGWMLNRYWLMGYDYHRLVHYEQTANSVTLEELTALSKKIFGEAANKMTLIVHPK